MYKVFYFKDFDSVLKISYKMMMDYFVTNNSLAPAPMGIQSTAGAVPVKNDKG